MPKRALTDASVRRLKPPASGQVDYFDRGYPGLALRVSYGGGRTFVFFYHQPGGKLRRLTLGTFPAVGLADARQAWREAREHVQTGRDPAIPKRGTEAPTAFAFVAEEWLRRDQAQNRSVAAVKRLLAKDVLPIWGHRQIADIGRRDVLDVIDAVADRGSPITARRLYAHLHRLFRWAVGRGIVEANPVSDLPKPGAETKRDRVLSDRELTAIWNAAAQIGWPFGDVVRLLILTGARRAEIGALSWNEIEGDAIKLNGERTKTANPHSIPLSAAASIVIQSIPRIADSKLAFTTNGTTSVSGWSRAKGRLDTMSGVKDWTIHDLRRTIATGLQKLGVTLQTIEAVLGHTSGSRSGVVGVYQRHSFDAEKRAALEAWGAHVTALIE